MRRYIGSVVAVLVGVVIAVIGAATHWPWPWWAWVIILGLCLVCVILAFPVRKEAPSTAFVGGDASGSTFRNVYSEADHFVRGNAHQALFWNVIHRSPPSRGR